VEKRGTAKALPPTQTPQQKTTNLKNLSILDARKGHNYTLTLWIILNESLMTSVG
jgi:hypothetical protein